jgi:hypothetical protein
MTSQGSIHFDRQVAIIACLIAGIANIPFNAMPLLLGTAADNFGLVPSQIGLLGGATLFGWVVGTALSFFLLHRVNWRLASIAGTLLTIIGLFTSLNVSSVNLLYLCWFILGLGASLPTCIAFDVIGKTAHPERYFGLMTLAVVLFSAAILWLFPILLIPQLGYAGMIFGLAGVFALIVVLTLSLPRSDTTAGARLASAQMEAVASSDFAKLAFIAFLIFFAGQSGLWAFLERAGREISIAPQDVGVILAVLKVIGGVACVMPILVADKWGDRWPFVSGFLGTLVGCGLLYASTTATGYAMGAWIWEFFFTVVFCYTNGAISRWDRSGRLVVLIPGAIGLGGAIGPAIAGFLKTGPGYLPIYTFTTTCMFICMCIMLVLLHLQGRGRTAMPVGAAA